MLEAEEKGEGERKRSALDKAEHRLSLSLPAAGRTQGWQEQTQDHAGAICEDFEDFGGACWSASLVM